jgi:hypothetical protein
MTRFFHGEMEGPKEIEFSRSDPNSDPVFADSSPQAGAVFDSVESVAQKELAVVAAVRQVIDVSWLDVTMGRGKEKSPIGDLA